MVTDVIAAELGCDTALNVDYRQSKVHMIGITQEEALLTKNAHCKQCIMIKSPTRCVVDFHCSVTVNCRYTDVPVRQTQTWVMQ